MATAKKKTPTTEVPAKAPASAKKTAAAPKTQTPRGRAQDRALVAGHQGYEVSYVAKHTGTTAAQVKAALEAEGHSRVKVTRALVAAKKTKKAE